MNYILHIIRHREDPPPGGNVAIFLDCFALLAMTKIYETNLLTPQKVPADLNVEPQKLRDDLTMIGHFANFYEIYKISPFTERGKPRRGGGF
jgi:hypothetical protein